MIGSVGAGVAKGVASAVTRGQASGGGGGSFDYLASAVGGYGIKKLKSAATTAIRIRRSTDNSEQDIGFSGNALDTATLLSFCGAGSGFITKWYDQSASGFDLVQATTTTQPRIVNSGVYDSGVRFDGSNDVLQTATNAGVAGAPWTLNLKLSHAARPASDYQGLFSLGINTTNQAAEYLVDSSGVLFLHRWGSLTSTSHTLALSTATTIALVWTGTAFLTYINGTLTNTNSGASSLSNSPLRIGDSMSGFNRFFNGTMTDVRLYSVAKTAQEIADIHNEL